MAVSKKANAPKTADAKPAATATRPKVAASKGSKATPAAMPKESKSSPKPPVDAKAAKKPAPVKLTAKQVEFLGKIHAAGEAGYLPTKAEMRSVDSLAEKKLLKKGVKDKATGAFRYQVTKAAGKHLPVAPAATPEAAPSA